MLSYFETVLLEQGEILGQDLGVDYFSPQYLSQAVWNQEEGQEASGFVWGRDGLQWQAALSTPSPAQRGMDLSGIGSGLIHGKEGSIASLERGILGQDAVLASSLAFVSPLWGALASQEVSLGERTLFSPLEGEVLRSGTGAEKLRSGTGAEKLRSGNEAEKLRSGTEAEKLRSGAVAEKLRSGNVAEELRSGNVAEELRSGDVAEKLRSGTEAEKLRSGDVAEVLRSGTVAEKLRSRDVAEKLRSGTGAEKLRSGTEAEVLRSGAVAEKLRSGAVAEGLRSGAEAEVFRSGDVAEVLRSGAVAEKLRSGAVAEELRSGTGAEVLRSGAEAEVFRSGAVAEKLRSGGMAFALGASLSLMKKMGEETGGLSWAREMGSTEMVLGQWRTLPLDGTEATRSVGESGEGAHLWQRLQQGVAIAAQRGRVEREQSSGGFSLGQPGTVVKASGVSVKDFDRAVARDARRYDGLME